MEEEKKEGVADWHRKHREEMWSMKNWRAWGSWYSWGSPVGLGLILVEIGVFLWLLHLADIIH
jgi:hypothetical protein